MLARVMDGDHHDIAGIAISFFFNMDDMVGLGATHHAIFSKFFYHDR